MGQVEMKIRGLKIFVSDENIKIVDSFKINNKEKMNEILDEIFNRDNCFFNTKRSRASLIHEWVSHNRLYKIHFLRKRTKDSDFENKINPIINQLYFILGFSKGEKIWKKIKKIKRHK